MRQTPSPQELQRQFRVLRQTLEMHTQLRDRYARWSRIGKGILIAASAVFISMTFASGTFFERLGLTVDNARLLLGFASLVSFVCSVLLLVVDFDGKAARHADATQRFARAIALFRRYRLASGSWDESQARKLSNAYWQANENSVSIPTKLFTNLKARYLLKVRISRLLDRAPGCPLWLLSLYLRARDLRRAIQLARKE